MTKTRSDHLTTQKVWLVCNAASGSNSAEAVEAVTAAFTDVGLDLQRTIQFPDEAAPDADLLERERVGMLAVFGGDGTVHAAMKQAAGWDGPVLVLPGGTMNMLSKRIHGDVPAQDIVARLAGGKVHCTRPMVVRTQHGIALTGVLAGPGAIWNEVREALRSVDLLEVVATTQQAIRYSSNGPKVLCQEVDCGREEGYAAITVTPQEDGLEANGYYAETLGDYAGQGIALLNRNFRDGPHDELGRHGKVRLFCPEGEPMGLLIDGEPFNGGSEELFEPVPCDMNLVTTVQGNAGDAR